MDVKVWLGGLESVNREMEGVDCIVAMEVYARFVVLKSRLTDGWCSIEHLPHHVLDYFAPVLLGAYHPRLLLMTTPSYTFNARFYPRTSLVHAVSQTPPTAPREYFVTQIINSSGRRKSARNGARPQHTIGDTMYSILASEKRQRRTRGDGMPIVDSQARWCRFEGEKATIG